MASYIRRRAGGGNTSSSAIKRTGSGASTGSRGAAGYGSGARGETGGNGGGGGDLQAIVISLKDSFYEKAGGVVGVYRDVERHSSAVLTLDLTAFPDGGASAPPSSQPSPNAAAAASAGKAGRVAAAAPSEGVRAGGRR